MRGRAEAPVDLLRERRIELGLPAQPAPFVPARLLLRRGALLGGAALLIGLVLTAVLNWRGQQQQQQLEALAPLAQRLTAAASAAAAAENEDHRSEQGHHQDCATAGGFPRRISPVGAAPTRHACWRAIAGVVGW